MTFPNVLITAHQAFLTKEALGAIASTTMENAAGLGSGTVPARNLVDLRKVATKRLPHA